MAPTTITSKGLQPKRPRPVSQMVMPVIPLPYVHQREKQKLKAAAEALAKAKREEEEALQTPIPPPVEEISAPTPPPVDAVISVANGSSDHTSSEKTDEISVPTSPEHVAEAIPVGKNEEEASVLQNTQEDRRSTPSEAPSAGSRTTYQMPPAFVPANLTNHSPHPSSNYNLQNSESPRFPPPPQFNGHMHHGHPSTSSLVFGGYPDSNTSSPAPLSAGNFPPPPFPPHGGHHPHHGPHQSNGGFMYNGTNGFSPMGPPPGYHPRPDGPGFMNLPADFSRRQMASFGPPEGYSPVHTPMGDPRVNAFDPLTPHSFQGSQSSAPAEAENASPAFGNFPVSNGTNGHVEEALRHPQQPRQKFQSSSQIGALNNFPDHPSNQPIRPIDHFDGLVPYLQSQFADPSLSDYMLELRYTDDRTEPYRLPGHGILLARSPVLKELMSNLHQGDGYGRTLLLESDSTHLRSDGFYMAVQRLYGGALLEPGVLATREYRPTPNSPPEYGTPEAQFHCALGYASAGMLLQIPPVVGRGVEFATHLISWTTVEKAVEFYLEGGLDSQWGNPSQNLLNPGPNANSLINSISSFVIKSFPAAFKLDSTVVETTKNPRLPIVNGLSSRLSGIKFGDHPSQETVASFASNAVTAILSRILLKLPFHVLKYVLESSRLGNVSGWATAALRQEVMQAVIDERENRRLKVYSSSVSNHDRNSRLAEWEVVGWQETVQPSESSEGTSTLQRSWVGFNS